MKKEDVYKLIEYKGVYDTKVKKNLKNLIKKYHPDKKNGSNDYIKIIYEVKKELENNTVSYKKKEEEKVEKTDYNKQECLMEIIKLTEKKQNIESKIKEHYLNLANTFKEYEELYNSHKKIQNKLCDYKDSNNMINKLIYLYILLSSILFSFSIIVIIFNKYYILGCSLVVFIFLFILILKELKKKKEIINKINKYTQKEEQINRDINNYKNNINKINDSILSLERNINKIEDDIRFYKNREKELS